VTEGLYEVSTPLGVVQLRLDGVSDSLVEESQVSTSSGTEDGNESLLLLTLPGEWFEPALLRRAWDAQAVDLCLDDEACADSIRERSEEVTEGRSGLEWRRWLQQWGKVRRIQLALHAGEREADAAILLAISFIGEHSLSSCARALTGDRLLVIQDPPRAAFPKARLITPEEFEAKAKRAWSEHVDFEKEIAHIDIGLVLREAADAALPGVEACFAPFIDLLCLWAEHGTLRATSTICAQRRLQEEDANASHRPPELFRRACWRSALRLMVQVRPNKEDGETLALALCEHWRQAHGICLDLEAAEVHELAAVLNEVWLLNASAEETSRLSAEEEARSAEKDLLEELDAEEGQMARDRKRRDKRRQKDREKRKKRSASKFSEADGSVGDACAGDEEEPEGVVEHGDLLAARHLLGRTYRRWVQVGLAAASKELGAAVDDAMHPEAHLAQEVLGAATSLLPEHASTSADVQANVAAAGLETPKPAAELEFSSQPPKAAWSEMLDDDVLAELGFVLPFPPDAMPSPTRSGALLDIDKDLHMGEGELEKGSRRSHRRRRRRSELALSKAESSPLNVKKSVVPSDASTASGSSPGTISLGGSEDDAGVADVSVRLASGKPKLADTTHPGQKPTPTISRNVVTWSDLLGGGQGPGQAAPPQHFVPPPLAAPPILASAPTQHMEHMWPNAWGGTYGFQWPAVNVPCAPATPPPPYWVAGSSPHVAAPYQDNEALRSWLSGGTPSGQTLVQQLKAVAPQAYED
jgi:hypothetical protein